VDQEAVDSISRMRLSVSLAARLANAGERRSRYQNAFHHAGTTMIASPRNTARRARWANFSGAIGRNRSKNLSSGRTTANYRLLYLRRGDHHRTTPVAIATKDPDISKIAGA